MDLDENLRPFILVNLCLVLALLFRFYIDGLVQDCSNSIANALELLESCTKPSIYLSIKLFGTTVSIQLQAHVVSTCYV